jgi:hypothetical protein
VAFFRSLGGTMASRCWVRCSRTGSPTTSRAGSRPARRAAAVGPAASTWPSFRPRAAHRPGRIRRRHRAHLPDLRGDRGGRRHRGGLSCSRSRCARPSTGDDPGRSHGDGRPTDRQRRPRGSGARGGRGGADLTRGARAHARAGRVQPPHKCRGVEAPP